MCFVFKYFRHLPPLFEINRSILLTVLGDTVQTQRIEHNIFWIEVTAVNPPRYIIC